MSWKTMLEGVWSGAAARGEGQPIAKPETSIAAANVDGAQRKTVPLPSILGPVRPPNALLPKGTPANLRRFAESPVPRRAINVIKDRIASMDWQIQLRRGYTLADVPDAHVRMEILRRTLEEPNDSDSFRSVVEQALEDALVGGFGAIEMERTDDPERPFALWPVDGATIQLNANWGGDQSSPRYAQNTNGVGPGSRIPLYDIQGHPNRMPFEGVLTLVDVPSDRAPSGSRGHRVTLSRNAAEAALPSLLGMAVDFRPDWDGHDARSKCGILTSADIVGQRLMVGGYLYARDFPEVEAKLHDLAAGSMGMSYELADAHVEDMRASIWKLNRVTFTGAAILLRDKAAYRQTSFRLKQQGTRRHGVSLAAYSGSA